MDEQTCYDLFWSLLTNAKTNISADGPYDAMAFISLLDETKQCDSYLNMSAAREKYRAHLSNNTNHEDLYEKIINIKPLSELEKMQAAKAQSILYPTVERCILQGLKFSDKLYYHTVERSQRTLVFIGLTGAVVSTSKIAFRFIRDQIDKTYKGKSCSPSSPTVSAKNNKISPTSNDIPRYDSPSSCGNIGQCGSNTDFESFFKTTTNKKQQTNNSGKK
ncbi:unnamed protein product [Adineta ricciae]|uniref:Uncharacterized protein n=1 Tax=Adineta ricciae TaxID=249248 RepID=A0A815YJD4_ADIRI|nr:unnamed protein product [Adineta ricciae]CAF1571452.1 unnamed protein product [Adineta ricciae]